MMWISGEGVKHRHSCDIPGIFRNNTSQEEMKATIMGATYNPEYNFKFFSVTKQW